jgi:6-pyruvoyl-tetrahydropterin synthase
VPGGKWVYCAQATISIALKIESMGYHLHGHDANVEVCVCADKPRAVDLVELRRALSRAASKYDHRPLWEALGLGEAVLEDLVEALERDLERELRRGNARVSVCRARVSVPGESVEHVTTGQH